jgi:hypothetical protein
VGGAERIAVNRDYDDLTPEAQDERDDFEARYGFGGNCSCHISPPCGSCVHPGNPLNQAEDDAAWRAQAAPQHVAARQINPEVLAMKQADLIKTLRKQRNIAAVEPIHATLAPVLAYVRYIGDLKGEVFHAVTIPEGSAAHGMGYRYASIPDDELAHYLASGATLAS